MYPGLFTPIWESMLIMTRALDHGPLTPTERTQITDFLRSHMPLIPCGGCALGAVAYYANHIPNFKTGEDAFRWVVDFHNDVNRKLGKREYGYEEADRELQARAQRDYQSLLKHEKHNRDNHKKMKELQTELDLFKNIPHATTNDTLFKYIIATLVIVIAVLFFLLIMFGVLLKETRSMQASYAN